MIRHLKTEIALRERKEVDDTETYTIRDAAKHQKAVSRSILAGTAQ